MAKLDLKSAYRMVLVHPGDSHLLGNEWGGTVYVDHALPFGLRSAPIIFSAVADGLACALFESGVEYSPTTFSSAEFLKLSRGAGHGLSTVHKARPPHSPGEGQGPSYSPHLSRDDSGNMSLSLPADKLTALKKFLSSCCRWNSASKLQLQELLGHLNQLYAQAGPSLVPSMKRPCLPHQRTRLDVACKADISWWSLFVADWNGPLPSTPYCHGCQ